MPKSPASDHIAFREGCYIVKGSAAAAIYDLCGKNIYSIDKLFADLFHGANEKMDAILLRAKEQGIAADEAKAAINRLIRLNLAEKRKEDSYVDKLKSSFSKDLMRKKKRQTQLFSMTCELTGDCTLNCIYCQDGGARISNCMCKKDHGVNENSISIGDWKDVIVAGSLFNCQKIRFVGGDPLLLGNSILELFSLAQSLRYERIEVLSNLSFLDGGLAQALKPFRLSIFVPIYSSNPRVHDMMTGVDGSFAETMRSVRMLRDMSIALQFCIMVSRQNENTISTTVDDIKDMGLDYSLEIVKPMAKSDIPNLVPTRYANLLFRNKPRFEGIDVDNFFLNKEWNPCWKFHAAISKSGDILPCIGARAIVVANVKNTSLREVLIEDKLDRYWSLCKDKVDTCRDCEFRYACGDCRVSAAALGGDLHSKEYFCKYNPLHAKWE